MPAKLLFRGLGVGLLLLLTTCTPEPKAAPQHPPEPPAPIASAAPVALTAQPDKAPPPPQPPPMNAWTDAAVVAELVKDCAFAPAADLSTSSALSCEIEVEQTCNYNECDALEEECRPRCIGTCNDCANGCRASCAACKTACRDASCTRACAESCGSCRQKCLKDKDHCATGVCGAAASACGKKLLEDYQKSGCARKVPKLQTCIEDCLNDVLKQSPDAGFMENLACQDRCESKVMPSCTRYHSHYRVF